MSVNRAEWLQQELSKLLGWDDMIIQGVVEAISNSSSRDDVLEIVENFMEGNKAAMKLVEEFWAKKDAPQPVKGVGSYQSTPAESQRGLYNPTSPRSMSKSYSQTGAPTTTAKSDVPAGYTLYNKRDNTQQEYLTTAPTQKARAKQKGPATSTPVSLHTQAAAPAPKVQAFPEQATPLKPVNGHKLGVGGTGKQAGKGKKGGGVRREGQVLAAASQLEKKVVNCLGCGKIFDCRSVTNEVIKFLESGGICTFCGKPVSLSYSSGSKATTPTPADAGPRQIGPSATDNPPPQAHDAKAAAASQEPDAATAAAIAFKNRLVEFDRNAAQRTTVIDDQSDYFEIDSNSWLNEQEREQLRLQQQMEEEAEAARRRRVKVTLDLLGRQVLLADDDYRAQERAVADALSGRGTAPLKTLLDGQEPAAGTMSMKDELDMVSHAQSEALKARSAASLRQLKITANPNITTPPPVFVPADKTAPATTVPPAGSTVANGKSKASGSTVGASHADDKGSHQTTYSNTNSQRAASRKARLAQRKVNRIQDENVFDGFEADLILDAAASASTL